MLVLGGLGGDFFSDLFFPDLIVGITLLDFSVVIVGLARDGLDVLGVEFTGDVVVFEWAGRLVERGLIVSRICSWVRSLEKNLIRGTPVTSLV